MFQGSWHPSPPAGGFLLPQPLPVGFVMWLILFLPPSILAEGCASPHPPCGLSAKTSRVDMKE